MMQAKLEALNDYEAKSNKCDCIWLLKEIQGITHRFEGTRNVFFSLDDAWCEYYSMHQGERQDTHEYLKDYQALVQVLEHYGAAIGADGPYLVAVKEKIQKESKKRLNETELRERSLTVPDTWILLDNQSTVSVYESAEVSLEGKDFLFAQSNAGQNIIPDTWILLDSQSTVFERAYRLPQNTLVLQCTPKLELQVGCVGLYLVVVVFFIIGNVFTWVKY